MIYEIAVLFFTVFEIIGWIVYRKHGLPIANCEANNRQVRYAGFYDGVSVGLAVVMYYGIMLFELIFYYYFLSDIDNVLFINSGLLFAIMVPIFGLLTRLLYKSMMNGWNRRLQKKHNDDIVRLDPDMPSSLLFNMAILLCAEFAYFFDELELVGICFSLLIGKYFGLDSSFKKPTKKEETLKYRLTHVPFFFYSTFVACVYCIPCYFIEPYYVFAPFKGTIYSTLFLVPCELIKLSRNAKKNPIDLTKPVAKSVALEVSSGDRNNSGVRIIRKPDMIEIIKENDTCVPIHDTREIVEYVKTKEIFQKDYRVFSPGDKEFSKKCKQSIEHYAKGVNEEEVVLLSFLSKKYGLILTKSCLYYGSPLEPNLACYLEHINKIALVNRKTHIGHWDVCITVDGYERDILDNTNENNTRELMNAFFEVIAFIYGYGSETTEIRNENE